MNKSSKNININSEEIKKYLSEKMSAKEMHQVEKQLLDDAFASDAVDGFEALNSDKINEKLVKIDLKKRLNKRISQEKNKEIIAKNIPLWQSISVAASVLLVLGFCFYFLTQKVENQQVTEKKETILSSKPSEVIISKDVEKDDLAMNKKPINKSKVDKEIAFEISQDKEESPPPVQSEIAVAKVESKADEKPIETPPIPTQIQQETRVAAAPKPSSVSTESAEVLAEVVVTGGSQARKSMPQTVVTTELNNEPIPEVGWIDYDNYLISSLKKTGSVSTLTFDEPLKLRLTIEPSGKLSNVQIDNNLSKEQTEKVVEVIEKGPKWLPARKKGKKIKKEVLRELKIK